MLLKGLELKESIYESIFFPLKIAPKRIEIRFKWN